MAFYWPPLACAFLWTFPVCACWKLAIKQSLGFASWQAWSGFWLSNLWFDLFYQIVLCCMCVIWAGGMGDKIRGLPTRRAHSYPPHQWDSYVSHIC
jgi:hypothetical protein